ncbi:hypothetical protein ACI7RC_16215 [Brevibacillus sp. B_LB10_24]|uniref:hypothetical protein n=1 Tax=Brevibacillus sp. B_LB10_24 TaxID=3380645 RepID=UPI0038B8CC25
MVKPMMDPAAIQWDYKEQRFGYVRQVWSRVDLHALQWAVGYKEKYGARITVLSLAGEGDRPDLRQLTRLPLDRVIVKTHAKSRLHGDEAADLLAEELTDWKVGLILCGSVSEDICLGITPAALAERLQLPLLTHVQQIQPMSERVWQVQRKAGGGGVETFELELPAIIGVVSSISRRRYIPRFAAAERTGTVFVEEPAAASGKKPKVQVIKVTEPQPSIRHGAIPSSALPPEKRLLEIMGLAGGRSRTSAEKVIHGIDDQNIQSIAAKLRVWLKGG